MTVVQPSQLGLNMNMHGSDFGIKGLGCVEVAASHLGMSNASGRSLEIFYRLLISVRCVQQNFAFGWTP